MSNFVFQNLRFNINKKLIHDENYYKCRELFPKCPSQVIIRAKDDVYAAYKSIKSNKQLSNLETPITKKNLSIRLDKKLYTSQDDYRHLERGIRKGCRYYTSDNLVFDAD